MEQFDTIVSLLPHIETVLKGKGLVLKRPDYEGAAEAGGEGDGEEEEEMMDDEDDDDDDAEEIVAGAEPKGRKSKGGKKNFEDTSEDE